MNVMGSSHCPSDITVSSKKSRRERSLGGCSTCRRRHVKCDERQPSCLVCESQKITCEGYEVKLVFDASEIQISQHRRPLFTMELRQRMTEMLTTSVRPDDVDNYLSQVDDECFEHENSTPINFSTELGPFGAFCIAAEIIEKPLQQSTNALINHRLLPREPEPVENVESPIDMYDFLADDALMECLFSGIDIPTELEYEHFAMTDSSPSTELEASPIVQLPHSTCTSTPTQPSLVPLLPSLVPSYAPALLSHYRDVIVPSFSPVSSTQTPWRILHLPVAMETLAQLNMGEHAASAKMTIFYSILATSAISLILSSSEGSISSWENQANTFFAHAQSHFKAALRQIQSGQQKVRYKDMLIAFLCMSTLWSYKGNEKKVERCLLDCEQWITMRGVPKPHKSRKVRLLHHCYLCSRTIYESTSVCRKPVFPANNPFRRFFHRQQWANRFEQRMNQRKGGPLVENDMHFEIPGKWDSSMYPEIFGIPEPLLICLAHTTRLANERQVSNSGHTSNVLGLKEFLERAHSLERYICRWQPPKFLSQNEPSHSLDTSIQTEHDFIISHMMMAMHKALLIYFYRRIYDADATIMQQHVEHIRELLSECSQFDVSAIYQAGSFVWVAFIAACEALNPATQDWFSAWFDICIAKSGLQFFQIVKNTVQQVWERNKQQICTSWPDILSEAGQNLFYI